MAFDRTKLGGNIGSGSSAPQFYTYITGTDNKAAVIAADYFAGASVDAGMIGVFEVGDFILATASDASVLLVVTKSDADEIDTGYVAVA